MQGFLTMGVIGLIIASVVNIFFKSPALYWATTYAGILIFVLLTAFDTQRLKQIHQSDAAGVEQLAVMGALRLYLDFINMFLFLLRLFGRRR
jgi:FtsH-binding integral membrane protein